MPRPVIELSQAQIIVVTLPDGKIEVTANGYVGKSRRIVRFDTVIKELPSAEIEAVLAHEIGHYRHRHIFKMLALSGGISLYGFWLMAQVSGSEWLYAAFGIATPSTATMLVCFSLVAAPITFLITPFFSTLSRAHEFEADRFAAQAVDSPKPLAAGLIKLYKKSLGNLFPHPWYSFVMYSHPPLVERLNALNKTPSGDAA